MNKWQEVGLLFSIVFLIGWYLEVLFNVPHSILLDIGLASAGITLVLGTVYNGWRRIE